MTRLEERLRTDFPALADAMLSEAQRQPVDENGPPVVEPRSGSGDRKMSRRAVLVGVAGAAAGGAVVLGTDLFRTREARTQVNVVGAPVPVDFGSWEPMAEAPIDPRPYAVAAWTGTRVVFWAGSNLSRGFAYTDGALYDPATDTWEPMAVPGWGHPGLTSAFFDGELYALAKGGGTRFDPVAGQWRDLPPVENMFLAATVATDDGIWGLGPADLNPVGQPDLAIARYLPDADTWVVGPTWEGTDDQASIIAGLSRLESTAVWTGTEIAVCDRTGGCIGFDPDAGTWRSLPVVSGVEGPSLAVATDLGLALIGQITTEPSEVAVEVLTSRGWQRKADGIPVERFDTATAAAAGEWLVIFAARQPPTVVHLPSGTWQVVTDGPLAGVEAPNVVWTGEQLVVWGGAPAEPTTSAGAVWTPPVA